jgi:hypothetical protein
MLRTALSEEMRVTAAVPQRARRALVFEGLQWKCGKGSAWIDTTHAYACCQPLSGTVIDKSNIGVHARP